ncbi:hypothetical protein SAY86_022315 [Trapa natans]|uniref:Dof zinc finger protein n=1 Tax=Trapa natans TaxID=22666 RepID=A0AAN7LTB8_TRANT|nr:hypothetical protein SAY86_022315 [Trapa natans]
MDCDGTQWPHQGFINGVVNKQPMLDQESTPSSSSRETPEKRALTRAQKGLQQEPNLNCPRCNSTNTKFCYYNNYSLSQPRYFCKTCRRYWTRGGSLRNVPVGGGSRKNKTSSSTTASLSKKTGIVGSPNLTPPVSSFIQSNPQNPSPSPIQGHDLNLAYDTHLPLLPQNPNFMALNNFPHLGSAIYPPSSSLFSPLQELKIMEPTLHYFSLHNNDNINNGLGSGISGGNYNARSGGEGEGEGGDDDVLLYGHDDSRRQGDEGGRNWNSSGMFGGGGGGSWQL